MALASKSASAPMPPEQYDRFPVLQQMLNRRGGDLSGGQQQLPDTRMLAYRGDMAIGAG